jgi:CBS domain-containing protein
MQNILQAGYYDTPGKVVRDLMTPDPEIATPGDSIFDLAQRLVDGPFRRFPVVENNRVVGMISRCDVMCALGQYHRK